MKQIPSDYTELLDKGGMWSAVYSNFDHQLEDGVVSQLKDTKVYAQHAAWNFCGHVWFDGKWNNLIAQYHKPIETITGNTIKEVIEQANERYGDD